MNYALWGGLNAWLAQRGGLVEAIPLDTYSYVPPGLQEATALRFEEGLRRTAIGQGQEVSRGS